MVAGPLRQVRFLLGRAGSGKTYRCLQEICEATAAQPLGPPLILLVPEQATYQMDRALLEQSSRRAQLRCQVVSFRRLAYLVLEGHLTRRRVLSDSGRQMVIQALLRRNRKLWRFFDASRVRPGWAAHLSRTIHEFRQYRVDSDMLKRAASELALALGSDSPLVCKLHDLALLLEDYQAFLAQHCYDSDDVSGLLTQAICQADWLRGAKLWVDSFGDFTKQEYEILRALLSRVSEVTFSLCLDPVALREADDISGETRLFHRAEETYRRLRELIPGATPVQHIHLPETGSCLRRFHAPELAYIEKQMFADLLVTASQPQTQAPVSQFNSHAEPTSLAGQVSKGVSAEKLGEPPSCPSCLTLIAARNRRAEVEYVARTIRQLVIQEGWRYRHVAVIVRRLEDYQSLIEAVFPDYGIPFFTDQRRSVRHHPLVELVRATVRVAAENWRRGDVIRWLRTELPLVLCESPYRLEIVDRLEQYADEHGLDGDVWRAPRWRIRPPTGDAAPEYLQPEVLNRQRLSLTEALAQFCQELGQEREVSVRTTLLALWQMLERLRVPETLQRWHEEARKAGRLDEAAEHAQVWESLLQLLEELHLALGDERLTLTDLAAVFETGLDSLTLGIVPPALDEVLIGAIERSRQPELRGVFLLGLNEGIFPLNSDEDAILNDSDREHLLQHGIELAPSSQARHYQEQYLGYIAFTRASERLWVSYALADEQNHPLLPSPFVERLRRLFPDLQPRSVEGYVSSSVCRLDDALTWHELASALAGRIRQASASGAGVAQRVNAKLDSPASSKRALLDHLASQTDAPQVIAMVRQAVEYPRGVHLPETLAKELFLQGNELRLSVSELESYAQCPFQFFASSGLRLRARKSFRLSRQDLGELLHRILQFFVRRYIREFLLSSYDAAPEAVALSGENQRESRLRSILDEIIEAALQEMEDDRFQASSRRQYVLRQARRILGDYVVALDRQLRRGSFIPDKTELAFGNENAASVSFTIELDTLAHGQQRVLLVPRGRIDRIDTVSVSEMGSSDRVIANSADPATGLVSGLSRPIEWLRVVDYKLSRIKLELDRIYHGLDLQLMLYLMVAQQLYNVAVNRGCAFYAPLRRSPKKLESAQESNQADFDEEWLRGYSLSGVFAQEAVPLLDHETESGYSPVVSFFRKKNGELGYKDRHDVVGAHHLQRLVECTRQHLRHIGEAILQGRIEVSPAWHRRTVPCTLCSWMAVCRFDRCWDEYRRLPTLSKKDVLKRLEGDFPCPS